MRVIVLGGTGFIGRHAAAALRARGHTVVIGTRHPRRALARLPASLRDCDLRETHFESLTTCYVWKPLIADVDAVVNCVGILRERGGETYDRVHNMAPAALGEACARKGVRLVHVSALGLRPEARSRFLRSKLIAERKIKASGADFSIVRPALLDGAGGYGAIWLRRVANWPVHLYPADAAGVLAPLDVRDLGDALAALCERGGDTWREVELGGGTRCKLPDYLDALRSPDGRKPAPRIPVPAPLARLGSHVCDLLHFSPFSYGHLELLRRDNLPRDNALPALIGRAPTRVGSVPNGAPEVLGPSDAYGSRAVFRNLLPYFLLLALAAFLHAVSPAAPWLLAPLIGLFTYRITIAMHDCIHRTLFKTMNLNERAGTLLGGVTGIDFASFSRQHLLHHRLYGRPGDPQGFHYLGLKGATRARFVWHLFRPLLGFNLRYALPESLLNPRNIAAAARRGDLPVLASVQLLTLVVVTAAGAYPWLAILPFVSAATFGLFFSQLRGIAEHAVDDDGADATNVRSHAPHWLDRIVLYDLSFNYHREHHLYPLCPSRDLAALHHRLPEPQLVEASMFRTLKHLAAHRT